jgi:hypothetical protein
LGAVVFDGAATERWGQAGEQQLGVINRGGCGMSEKKESDFTFVPSPRGEGIIAMGRWCSQAAVFAG